MNAATSIAVSRRLGNSPYADAGATVVGSLAGTSTVVSYIESASGVSAGGRTGLTAVVTGLLFLAAGFGPAAMLAAAVVLKVGENGLRYSLDQATRELLLLQASDWQFLITTGTARDYAERRVAEHYAEFKRLAEMARRLRQGEPLSIEAAELLRRLEREDFCFPELDPAWGQSW